MTDQKFEWKCPRLGCTKEILAFTQRGMNLLAEEHIYKHMREDREKAAQPNPEAAIEVYKPKDYDTLRVTKSDIGFLRTRGIQIDDNIVIEEK